MTGAPPTTPPTTSIVFTTIAEPIIARDFCENLDRFGHKHAAGLIVIGDRKSPDEASERIARDLRSEGFDVQYCGIAAQERWLERFPEVKRIVPYDTDNRRNVGFLMAKERASNVLISVDDDNFPLADVDFVGEHTALVGRTRTVPVIRTSLGWYNICDLLENATGERIFPRGFPYAVRRRYPEVTITSDERDVPIMLNAGLWLREPDVDAITRLERNTTVTSLRATRTTALDVGVFSPINSQNTALHMDLLPAYYYVLMGEYVDGLRIDRYADIWSGFFLKKVMDLLGWYVSFGVPLVDHRRNLHDPFKDLKEELTGITYTESLVEFLESVSLRGDTPADIYDALGDELLRFVSGDSRFGADFKKFIAKVHGCQKVWLEACAALRA